MSIQTTTSPTLALTPMQLWQENHAIKTLIQKISKRLIITLQIQEGVGLCYFLEMDRVVSNHESVRLWTKAQILAVKDRHLYDEDGLYDYVESCFISQLPDHQ